MKLKLGDKCPHCHNKSVVPFLGSKANPMPVQDKWLYNLRCDICDWFFIIDSSNDEVTYQGR